MNQDENINKLVHQLIMCTPILEMPFNVWKAFVRAPEVTLFKTEDPLQEFITEEWGSIIICYHVIIMPEPLDRSIKVIDPRYQNEYLKDKYNKANNYHILNN